MLDEARIRDMLIDSCHSSADADAYFRAHLGDADLLALFVKIARDEDGHLGDAPMQAAYWVSKFPPVLLLPHEPALVEMLSIVDGYGGHVALALGKTGSERGRNAIIEELGDGTRFDAWLFRKGLQVGKNLG
jgi:hypothetical protein